MDAAAFSVSPLPELRLFSTLPDRSVSTFHRHKLADTEFHWSHPPFSLSLCFLDRSSSSVYAWQDRGKRKREGRCARRRSILVESIPFRWKEGGGPRFREFYWAGKVLSFRERGLSSSRFHCDSTLLVARWPRGEVRKERKMHRIVGKNISISDSFSQEKKERKKRVASLSSSPIPFRWSTSARRGQLSLKPPLYSPHCATLGQRNDATRQRENCLAPENCKQEGGSKLCARESRRVKIAGRIRYIFAGKFIVSIGDHRQGNTLILIYRARGQIRTR